jgi:hypothetical protein
MVWPMETTINQQNTADADSDEKPIHRRAVLAATGAVSSILAVGSASAEATTGQGETVETIPCGEHVRDHIGCDPGTTWATGAVTIVGCPDCNDAVQVQLEVTNGASTDPCASGPDRLSTITVRVDPGERQTVWFAGRIDHLQTSSSHARIGINMNDCRAN